jgi:hypothetical protein
VRRESIVFDFALAGDKIDLTVFMRGLANGSSKDITSLKTIGYLLLDAAVGE